MDPKKTEALFDRVISILEQARNHVVRAVNTQMVLAYWLIGREIVEELQRGEKRTEYGQQILELLSAGLTARYGRGYSVTNLKYFRLFYQAYPDRLKIRHPVGDESAGQMLEQSILLPAALKSEGNTTLSPPGTELAVNQILRSAGGESSLGFSPQLTWSHYRALMRVEDVAARDFYEREAAECGWSKAQLERQIHSFYYDRILANHGKEGLQAAGRERLPGKGIEPTQLLKSPMVLEFLGLPDSPELHESKLEQAIIDNLQNFLLELGKGFSFVARQKHIRFGDEDFYIDLVFYNYVLKCFLLVELKMGKLSHADIGQMDGYVRLYEDQFKVPGDNPTIGLLLCSDKSEAVAKYSILSESRQIFATKYLQTLPTEEQLRQEIQRERHLIESALEDLTHE
jgi:predicted nuclease of restriction endonuclease-like (RecB) superfamily